MKASLQHLEAGLRETKGELRADVKDLGNKMDKELKDLGNKMDRKFDRLLYLVISGLVGLVLKGGFDHFVIGKEVKGSAQPGREK
jgi:hypothetical protein